MKRPNSKAKSDQAPKIFITALKYFGVAVFMVGVGIGTYGVIHGESNLMWNGAWIAALGALLAGKPEILNYI